MPSPRKWFNHMEAWERAVTGDHSKYTLWKTESKLDIYLFLLTKFGPTYYGPCNSQVDHRFPTVSSLLSTVHSTGRNILRTSNTSIHSTSIWAAYVCRNN